jgi:hypothetical protein
MAAFTCGEAPPRLCTAWPRRQVQTWTGSTTAASHPHRGCVRLDDRAALRSSRAACAGAPGERGRTNLRRVSRRPSPRRRGAVVEAGGRTATPARLPGEARVRCGQVFGLRRSSGHVMVGCLPSRATFQWSSPRAGTDFGWFTCCRWWSGIVAVALAETANAGRSSRDLARMSGRRRREALLRMRLERPTRSHHGRLLCTLGYAPPIPRRRSGRTEPDARSDAECSY